jgi:hypothetical protein
MPRPPKPSRDQLELSRENSSLKTTICCLRREIEHKQGHVHRLEVLLASRLQTIDQLHGTVEQLRERNRKLDAEAEHLADIIKLDPARPNPA